MEHTEAGSLNRKIERVVLAGFMGAGKSTVGRLLARQLGWQFFDADEVIQVRNQATIAEIFSSGGEAVFRRLEAETIHSLLVESHSVISLGGGALETSETRELLLTDPATFLVFLDAPLDILLQRCEQQPGAAIRPVLLEREKLQERFARRLPHFRRAHLIVPTSGISPTETAMKIAAALPVDKTIGTEKVGQDLEHQN
ncbi:shikimate kinase [Acidipila rosea]|uniref:Shikimate kinase n=1 Tax=Acidipila rosea TaxID=768535 RepID=A0A4R1LAG4_9BACT|nr:shikimate kinase [Acidipila rosea]TCK75426.1 shikimate kinase [Acidipila rosea]